MDRSLGEYVAAEGALVGLFHPALQAAPVVDVAAGQLHDKFLFLEAIYAYGTCSGTLLHYQGLDPIGFGHRDGVLLKAGKHGDL